MERIYGDFERESAIIVGYVVTKRPKKGKGKGFVDQIYYFNDPVHIIKKGKNITIVEKGEQRESPERIIRSNACR